MIMLRFALATLVVVCAPLLARADDAAFAEARALNAKGRELLDAGDPGGALAVFQRAYMRSPNPELLLNIGTSYKRLGRNAAAANAYQRYLDEPGGDPSRVSEVRTLLAVLDTSVGRLDIDLDGEGDVQINDGDWQARERSRVLRVDAGSYVLRARRGAAAAEVSGRIGAGEQRVHRLVLRIPVVTTPIAPAVAIPPLPPPARPSPASHGHRGVAALFGGIAVGAFATGGVFELRARDRYAAARTACGDGCAGPAFTRANALVAGGDRDRVFSIGLAVGGSVALAAAAYAWFRPQRDARRPVVSAQLATDHAVVAFHHDF
jgi:hypothetical protein